MKEEEQRVAILKACGWSNLSADGAFGKHLEITGNYRGSTPNPPRDLNAMHEAEKVLPNVSAYIVQLKCVVNEISIENFSWPALGFDAWALADVVLATAPQRAEAFLRTLNMWTK